MKPQHILIVPLFLLAAIVHVHGNARANEANAETQQNTTQYLIELSEYELEQAIPVGLGEAEVIDAIRSSGAKPVETIRLTALSDTESMVQFGKRMAVTTASITRGDAITRQTKEIEIGTILRLRIKPHAKGAIADIDYSTNRVDGEGTDDSPPDVLTNTMQSTQVYVLGKSRLLSTMGIGKLTGVIVIVREIP
jgi:predicted RecA/RadA family phage recombinase